MELILKKMKDADCHIILEEVNNREHPLRELRLKWSGTNNAEPRFIESTKAIGAHKTLVKFTFPMNSISRDNKLAALLEALKDNRSIKDLSTSSEAFDLDTARAFA
jgi:hypothetical protein